MQALTFFFAFVAVLALIGAAAWLVRKLREEHGDGAFTANMGAEAIRELRRRLEAAR